jgi:hypothetical protein
MVTLDKSCILFKSLGGLLVEIRPRLLPRGSFLPDRENNWGKK